MKSPIKHDDEIIASLSYLKQIIPKGSVITSYLFFSGTLEFSLCEAGRFVMAKTNKYVVEEFWSCMLEDARLIYNILKTDTFSISSEDIFYLLQETWMEYADPFVRSALFVYLNNCTKKGSISSGSPETFEINPFSLSSIKNFKVPNFHISYEDVDCDDVLNSVCEQLESDYVLLPVGKYSLNLLDGATSVGHETTRVNHKNIKNIFENTKNKKIILIYKFDELLIEDYKNYNKIMIDKRGNQTNQQSKCEEIIVTNF